MCELSTSSMESMSFTMYHLALLVNLFISLVIKKKIILQILPLCQALCLVPVKQRLIKYEIMPNYSQIRDARSSQMIMAKW